jgi:YD repeat-containing protein
MKLLTGIFCLLLFGGTCQGQYYYKDIIVLRQTEGSWKTYHDNRVKSVALSSYEANGQATEGFTGEQTVSPDFTEITTYTKSNQNVPSNLISVYDSRGLLRKTVDTSESYQSTTEYFYDGQGRLQSILNRSLETDNQINATEAHAWNYDASGVPISMLKIKNGTDTTFFRFLRDEKGNITEEHSFHGTDSLPVVYYYYDDQNRLTDIVRYNVKAKRLLPDYMFEYDGQGRLSSMLVVPEGNDYQKWQYQYDEKGLKSKESCFGKGQELLGRIEYAYR